MTHGMWCFRIVLVLSAFAYLGAHGTCAAQATSQPSPSTTRAPGAAVQAAPAQAAPAETPASVPASEADAPASPAWVKLPTEPYKGKQDDICFVSPERGWYGNGAGKIFGTSDGGASWSLLFEQPGTFVRCLTFVDENIGIAGNIGTDYFPGVTDTTPLYRTADGGATWAPVTELTGDTLVGVCALQVQRIRFINAGELGERVRLIAAGRVGGPAAIAFSEDLGVTWRVKDLSDVCGMILDVHFFNQCDGVLAAASSRDAEESHALVLRTKDAGETWTTAYLGERSFELTWKLSFPTRETGYVTIQSYDPDPAASARFVGKTTDGGATWKELPLVNEAAVREFGVGFVDAEHGWVGAAPHGFRTWDGGAHWVPDAMGNAVNKIRVVPGEKEDTLFAIGVEVHKLVWPQVMPDAR